MSFTLMARQPGRAKGALAMTVMTALVMATAGSVQASAPTAPDSAQQLYIVQMAGQPVAAYTGGTAGIAATKPAEGSKVDLRSAHAKAYREYLKAQHDKALNAAGLGTKSKTGDLGVVFNGFAAKLTAGQAAKLAGTEGVLAVVKDEVRKLDTISTPKFLGLEGSSGVWQKEFGGDPNAGQGVIVGVVDTGFWPESPSFASLPEPRPDQAVIDGKWFGVCTEGDTNPVTCNNKVIGARFYNTSGVSESWESLSPRDDDSHGSHTASTAAGNHGVDAVINGVSQGNASGMAPAARIAAYKVCWAHGCGTFDSVHAIEDAIADGVDVINYSISGSLKSVLDPVEIAFFNAAAAGVFVSASAGNSGPGASTVAHNSPWLTTVAASTHDRSFTKTVTLGNGVSYTGVGTGPAVASAPLIDSITAALGAPADAELCKLGSLDPVKVAGKIVLCKRGVNARVEKSQEVRDKGGLGMVMYNNPDSSLNADFHYVPTVHLNSAAGLAVKAYAAGVSPTASLGAGVAGVGRAPNVASFSSAGPALSGAGDLLKPDITAPGVDVIAAVSPTGNNGNLYNALSGTSMSSPHIAGLAALVRSKHPSWPPMWVKSALMTTASQLDNTGAPIQRGAVNATPLDFGSGHVNPAGSFDPGLVYDSSYTEWVQFICGTGQMSGSTCDATGTIDPSDLNYPSIAIGDLGGSQTVKRRVTNTSDHAVIYKAVVEAPAGMTVKVMPEVLIIPKGRTASFTVKFTNVSAPIGAYAFGSLTWKEFPGTNGPLGKRDHVVRSTIAVRPAPLSALGEISGTGTSGSVPLTVRAGYNGTLTAAARGLVPATVTDLAITGSNPDFDAAAPAVGTGVAKVTVSVPAGSTVARFATFDSDVTPATDLDLFVYAAGTSTQVASSAGGTSNEAVTLGAGDYDVYVVVFALAPGQTGVNVKHHHWIVPASASGNLTVSPASQSVTFGATKTVTASWSALTAGVRYLGAVVYSDGTNTVGTTLVSVTG